MVCVFFERKMGDRGEIEGPWDDRAEERTLREGGGRGRGESKSGHSQEQWNKVGCVTSGWYDVEGVSRGTSGSK